VFDLGNTRLEAWSKLVHARVLAWPCDSQWTWDELLSFGVADCGSWCQQKPIAVLATR
jgi:hypothetical protein